MIIDYERCLLG